MISTSEVVFGCPGYSRMISNGGLVAEDGGSMFLRNVGIYLLSPHCVTTLKTNIGIFTAARISNLIFSFNLM
jgi:hypothetical protein